MSEGISHELGTCQALLLHYGSDAVVLSEWSGCMKMLPLSLEALAMAGHYLFIWWAGQMSLWWPIWPATDSS